MKVEKQVEILFEDLLKKDRLLLLITKKKKTTAYQPGFQPPSGRIC